MIRSACLSIVVAALASSAAAQENISLAIPQLLPGTDRFERVFGLKPAARQDTVVNDKRAAQMLLGRHKLSLQWISWDYFGTATVTKRGGLYYLKGEQKGRGNNDIVTVDGVITSIDAKEFAFDGTVTTRISHINGGKSCERKGPLTFRITGKRKYWRMQQIDNPCDQAADYVDIYFR